MEAFDYIIVNHDFFLDHTVDMVRAIIESEHHRVKQRKVKFVNSYPASSPDQQPAPPPQTMRVAMPSSRPYVTYSIMGITIGFYLLQLVSVSLFGYANDAAQMDWLELYGSKINSLIRAGELWRLLTPVLLHASIPHILLTCMHCS